MLDFSKYIYPKHIYEKEGKELLSALRGLVLKILIGIDIIYTPFIILGISGVSINSVEYFGVIGMLLLLAMNALFYLILPYAMYAQIGIDKGPKVG